MGRLIMMVSITHCWKNTRLDFARLLVCALLTLSGLVQALHAETALPEVSPFKLERSAESLALTAIVRFDLPPAVEDALLKGIPVIFVAEVDVYRERWYWTDKKIARTERYMRLLYQPLTRRWRLMVGAGLIANNGIGVALNQSFDSLDDALSTIRRFSGWRIADLAEMDAGVRHRVEFRFRLDASQLPRPLQIGTVGQSDWSLAVSATQRIMLESLK
jgi:Domain of unknown function (DUF4390)